MAAVCMAIGWFEWKTLKTRSRREKTVFCLLLGSVLVYNVMNEVYKNFPRPEIVVYALFGWADSLFSLK
ncbi:hypothetical protein [Paenibacillus tyrfis]|uniref:hypothetical protein n=1 Tax=Paenibacillus tyrfis TaxID=1501230 RepID=UPI0020A184A7|nr:hypothetical protein [Paenibacillus tyrfis]MCP1307880.1 hypothetical protein [Paenibacillus tyrfis]